MTILAESEFFNIQRLEAGGIRIFITNGEQTCSYKLDKPHLRTLITLLQNYLGEIDD